MLHSTPKYNQFRPHKSQYSDCAPLTKEIINLKMFSLDKHWQTAVWGDL